jgi:hypothetical protein
LIGDSTSAIINGVWVKFNAEIKASYGTLLRKIYDLSLKWAYDPHTSMPEDKIKQILPTISKEMDFESFQGHFAMWKYVSTKLRLQFHGFYASSLWCF